MESLRFAKGHQKRVGLGGKGVEKGSEYWRHCNLMCSLSQQAEYRTFKSCFHLTFTVVFSIKRCIMPPSSASMFYQRDSGCCQMKMWMNSGAQPTGVRPPSPPGCFCRLIRPRGPVVWPLWTGLCVKDTWAKMAERDILNVWLTAAPFLQGSSCQKGSIVCNVIHCKLYTEEIHVIKAAESDPWPGHYHCLITSVVSGH